MTAHPSDSVVHIPVGQIKLEGELILPPEAKGIVVFAHGSGSSRLSPRNQFVANFLREHQLATLLIDLLTPEEERIDQITREIRFNIHLLAHRLLGLTHWLLQQDATKSLFWIQHRSGSCFDCSRSNG